MTSIRTWNGCVVDPLLIKIDVIVSGCAVCSRLESLWHDELKKRGREGASLTRVFMRFCQTRMLVAIFALLLTMVAGFVGPVSTSQILFSLDTVLIR